MGISKERNKEKRKNVFKIQLSSFRNISDLRCEETPLCLTEAMDRGSETKDHFPTDYY